MERFVLLPESLFATLQSKQNVGLLDKKQSLVTPQEARPSVEPEHISKIKESLKKPKNTQLNTLLNSPRISFSQLDTILLDGRDTNIDIVDFITKVTSAKSDFPDSYYTILDAANFPRQQVYNKNAKKKDQGNWIPFKF